MVNELIARKIINNVHIAVIGDTIHSIHVIIGQEALLGKL